jgi:uncharacterized DUF497 family protein
VKFKFNKEKNEKILQIRGIGFEEIIAAIQIGNLVDVMEHHNASKYPNQEILYVKVQDNIYMVPYIIEADGTFFLKTLYPSRKATKRYMKNNLKINNNSIGK